MTETTKISKIMTGKTDQMIEITDIMTGINKN